MPEPRDLTHGVTPDNLRAMELQERLARNLARIRAEVSEASAARGRAAEGVRLVAVTKGVGLPEISALVALGQRDLGENRAEQLIPRADEAQARGLAVNWHMVGHLQRRKVRDLLPRATMIHSLDSLRLAEEIQKRAEQAAACHPPVREGASGTIPVPVLLEVNVSGEEQKYGVRPEGVGQLVRDVARLPRLDLRGLMTMAPLVDDPEKVRPVFRALRELRERLNDAAAYSRPLVELSMGMSQDYRVAVQEGATMVRIGTALFA